MSTQNLRFAILLILLIQSVGHLAAQSEVRGGPYMAVGLRELRGNVEGGSGGTIQLGVQLEVPLKGKLGLQPLISYVRKGSRTYDGGYFNYNLYNLKLDYFTLSAPVRFMVDEKFYLLAGLQTGILLFAEYEQEGREIDFFGIGNGEHYSTANNMRKSFRTLDLGASVGVGLQFKNGMGMDLRSDFGLMKCTRSNVLNPELTGTNFTLMFGYYILIKNNPDGGR